jgi:hypothetical protein
MSILDDSGLLVAFGQAFRRSADLLTNRALDEIFNPNGDATRLTVVVIYNRTDQTLFLVDTSFDSGEFSDGKAAPFQIAPNTASAYRVESHGFAAGVTGAHVRYGAATGDATQVLLDINTSNPFVGDNHSEVQAFSGFGVVRTDSGGNSNQVDVDFVAQGSAPNAGV